MRIGLISDTHIPEARAELWPEALDAFRDVDVILHAGDLHELTVVEALAEVAPVYVAIGNGDDGSSGRRPVPADPRLQEAWTLDFEGVVVGMTHALPIPEIPPHITLERALARHFPERRPDVLIHGHTHVESIETVDGILCVNPGSPTYPHNLNTQFGTVGFLDIEDGKAEASVWQLVEGGLEPFDWGQS